MANQRKSRRDQLADQLTAKQIKAAHALIENELAPGTERKTQDQLADELGCDRKTLFRWRTENQAFIEYKKEVARDFLSDAVGIFARQLIKSMDGAQPSQKALDLYAKMMGFIKNEHSVEVTTNDARSSEDIARELAELDEQLAATKGGNE